MRSKIPISACFTIWFISNNPQRRTFSMHIFQQLQGSSWNGFLPLSLPRVILLPRLCPFHSSFCKYTPHVTQIFTLNDLTFSYRHLLSCGSILFAEVKYLTNSLKRRLDTFSTLRWPPYNVPMRNGSLIAPN